MLFVATIGLRSNFENDATILSAAEGGAKTSQWSWEGNTPKDGSVFSILILGLCIPLFRGCSVSGNVAHTYCNRQAAATMIHETPGQVRIMAALLLF